MVLYHNILNGALLKKLLKREILKNTNNQPKIWWRWQNMCWAIIYLSLTVRRINQKSGTTTIGTKFAPPFACICMDQAKQKILQAPNKKMLIWFRYIDDIFFIWTHAKEELECLKVLHNFTPNLSFTHEGS